MKARAALQQRPMSPGGDVNERSCADRPRPPATMLTIIPGVARRQIYRDRRVQ